MFIAGYSVGSREIRKCESTPSTNVVAAVRNAESAKKTNVVVKATAEKVVAVSPSVQSAAPATNVVEKPKPPAPYVKFADNGRYLPFGGANSVRFESLGVKTIATTICRIEPRNVVQMLAREERVYRRYGWWDSIDDDETEELAGAAETGNVICVNRPCEKEINLAKVAMNDGGPERGIFLLSAIDPDRKRNDYRWWCEADEYNPLLFRVVCLSDLGLSVRKCNDTLGVWVASLMTGKPLREIAIEVYSSANILVGTGVTDDRGWCEVKRSAKGEPFAVVAIDGGRQDMSFMALRASNEMDESPVDGGRDKYLKPGECTAFLWTDRGIYRHGEKIFLNAIVRDREHRAPKPMPLVVSLNSPLGKVFSSTTKMTDSEGVLSECAFSVPDEQPSGDWLIQVKLPGKDGKVLGDRVITVEEFAPPQIRVKVEAEAEKSPTNFSFKVKAEHLFGGPARDLRSDGVVVFEDVSFAPAQWKGFEFGNDDLGLKPCHVPLKGAVLDDKGEVEYSAPIGKDVGLPKAAVKATAQGTVFEDGGRPATARRSVVCHYYPYYLGANLSSWLKLPQGGRPSIDVVCVDTEGKALAGERELKVKIERISCIYSCKRDDNGMNTWDCQRVRTAVVKDGKIVTAANGRSTYELPLAKCGDYHLTIEDPKTGVSFGRTFYLSDWGDDEVRAPLSNPRKVTVAADKPFYRVGEIPRLVVKSPFAGYAMMSVLHDRHLYTEILKLTNATSEVTLRRVERDWAPNVDVMISVVQSVEASAKHLAARSHGQVTIAVRPIENEITVGVRTSVTTGRDSKATVELTAPGAKWAVVSLVDEGINLLTDEPVPDPLGYFAAARTWSHPLYDYYDRILPVAGDGVKAAGMKTGGGFGADLLGRVSPVATRRFKPLAMWKEKLAISGGRGRTEFALPEFAGEVRVTAVAYGESAVGSIAEQVKVAPKLIMQTDAPRFVAPGDRFGITMVLRNRSGKDGEAEYSLTDAINGKVFLRNGEDTNVTALVTAPGRPGEMALDFRSTGFGEEHRDTILMPVRPAVAWRATSGAAESEDEARKNADEREGDKLYVTKWDNRIGEFTSAIEWLADYPHGCLEQTCSRIFPLITAGGVFNQIGSKKSSNRKDFVAAGVKRVESMIRQNDFTMWPDSDYAPWDREVSLYAAHFLIEAKRGEIPLDENTSGHVIRFLFQWSRDTNTTVSAYACHTLAIAGRPDKDRMNALYDRRKDLNALSRARLARAFAAVHDVNRARTLIEGTFEPQSVKEAAFLMLALLEIDPEDGRIVPLLKYLTENRDRAKYCWGTTEENAHALLAIGAYYQRHSNKLAKPFWFWKKLSLPEAEKVADESNGIFLERRYFDAEGNPADMSKLVTGQLLTAELSITCDVTRVLSDLVIEDLFPAAFEPVHSAEKCKEDWVLRTDARDDRMLVFSKKFTLEKGHAAKVRYSVRVVTAGDYVLPGPSVEGMYDPRLRSHRAAGRIVVRH